MTTHTPTKAAPKATTTTKATKATTRKAAPAKSEEPTPKAPAKRSRKASTPTTPDLTGYEVRWPHAGYDLLKKSDASTEGPAWYVRCNAHGAVTPAANTKEGDQLGRKADRAAWCATCGAA